MNTPVLTMEKEMEVLTTSRGYINPHELSVQANNIQLLCTDTQIKAKHLYIDGNILATYVEPSDKIGLVKQRETRQFSDHAFSQLCAKVGVPVRYMKKCIEEGLPNLAQDNLNAWLKVNGEKELLIRNYGTDIRGVLSSKYSILDTPDILDSIYDVINPDEYKVKSYCLNEERFHARLIQQEKMKVAGEDLFAGIQIDSSDVGRNNLVVQFFIYKQVCTNGLVIPKMGGTIFQQKHIGISSDQFVAELKENIKLIPDLVAKSSDLILASKTERLSKAEFEKILAKVKEGTNLSEKDIEEVKELVHVGYTQTRWGVVNAITELSQRYTLDRRIELERYAGNLLVA